LHAKQLNSTNIRNSLRTSAKRFRSVVIILIITADLTNSLPVPMVRTPHHFSSTVDCGINHNGKITHNFERNAPKSCKTGKKVIHKNAFKSSVKQYLISGRKKFNDGNN